MWWYWDSAVQPLLEARAPRTLVEVGSSKGQNTRLIAAWAAEHGAVLHAIDPKPRFDVDSYTQQWPGHLVFHRELSPGALAAIGPVDMMLLDGDHNWYTVMGELREIDRLNPEWPLLLMHDVGWPYGRRDMYYAPERIPAEHRHPSRRGAIKPFQSALKEQLQKAPLVNAEHEGGRRNGVLTAVEDFLAGTDRDLMLFLQAGMGGLGVIASADALARDEALARAVASVHDVKYAVTISPAYATREFGEATASQERPQPYPFPRPDPPSGWGRLVHGARRRVRRASRPSPR